MIRTLALASAALLLAGGVAVAQNYTLAPAYGEVDLAAGFLPDPHPVTVEAGGTIDVAAANLGPGCTGFIADAPDYRLQYTPGTNVSLYISVLSQGDTTLVINDPSGNWLCDDDSNGDLNPKVTIATPMPGQYDIWIGTYASATYPDATLNISEIN